MPILHAGARRGVRYDGRMALTRREFLAAASAAAATTLAGCARPRVGGPSAPDIFLRAAGKRSGILAGCAVSVARLLDTPDYAALIAAQAGIVVAENEMKWAPLRPSPTTYNFFYADALFAFAQKHAMQVRGHNLCWHRQLPDWFASYVTPANAEHVLVDHIERVAGRYAGRVHSWDVVNEAIQLKDGLPGSLRASPWQRLLPGSGLLLPGSGPVPAYIEIAFRTARRVDPKALLAYNDYGIEGDDAESEKKRAAVLALLRAMKLRGVPVDALGIQSHISAGRAWDAKRCAGLRALIAEAREMGLKVMLTEMDVNDRELPADIPTRDAGVAAAYGDYLHEALADEAVIALLTWGITDRYTWLDYENGRADKLPNRCLPFDETLRAKSAFAAEVNALYSVPRRK